MRNFLLALVLACMPWVALAQVGPVTTLPGQLRVKPIVADRTVTAMCVWGGLSLSTGSGTCNVPIIATDGSISTTKLTLAYQTNTITPSVGNPQGLFFGTAPDAFTFDFLGAGVDNSKNHSIALISLTDTDGVGTPYVSLIAQMVGTGYAAIVLDGENSQANVNGDIVLSGALSLTGSISDSNSDVTIADGLIVTGVISDSDSDVTVNDGFVVVGNTDLRGLLANSTGDVAVNDNLYVVGTTDLRGLVANSTGDIGLNDNLYVVGTTDLRSNVSNSTGNLTLADTTDITATLSGNTGGSVKWVLGPWAADADYNALYLDGANAGTNAAYNILSGTSDNHLYLNAPTDYSVRLRVNNADVAFATGGGLTIKGPLSAGDATGTQNFGNTSNRFATAFLSLQPLAAGFVNVVTDATGELFYDSSTRDVKKNIEDALSQDVTTLELRPRLYNGINDPEGAPKVLGIIAEEVPEALQDDLVVRWTETRHDGDFEVVSVRYDRIALLLLDVVKTQQAKLASLEARIAALEARR